MRGEDHPVAGFSVVTLPQPLSRAPLDSLIV
jgi:hypothetical protein